MAVAIEFYERIYQIGKILKKYAKFIGPGLMVSVAYMDPGNYSTAVAAGSAYKYNLLFSIFISNCLAIFLQILAAKLGCVTGLDLAANCKANFSFTTNIVLYILTEIAIIATDLAEVVGTAIALNILFKLPLIIGVLITIIDVLVVLMAYRPNGPLFFIRLFELFVTILVGATIVCFAIELYQVSNDESIHFSSWEVFKGFLPNKDVVDMSDRKGGNGLYLSLAILGATVMPHSLYLGSGLVQARLKDFDIKNGHYRTNLNSNHQQHQQNQQNNSDQVRIINNQEFHSIPTSPNTLTPVDEEDEFYRPSVHAINETMSYTIWELVISLLTVALFVNSAILIVAGATLDPKKSHNGDDSSYANADLFTIYNLLTTHLSPTAGFVFALALLCSGQSAGVVCTLAGQMVSEGFLNWSLPPVTRRLVTRALAIIPCLLVVTLSGREGLASILNSSQVVLSLLLPVVTAPLIYFTCSKGIMRVPIFHRDDDLFVDDFEPSNGPNRYKSSEPAIRLQDFRNSHPCNFEDDEDLDAEENQRLKGSQSATYNNLQIGRSETPTLNEPNTDYEEEEEEEVRVTGYKDFSNGTAMAIIAVLIWGFITCLNLYLIVSVILGYDVPL